MPVRRLGASEASKLAAIGYVFLDVRAPEEYAKGHPKGAINIPWKLFSNSGNYRDNAQFLEVVKALFPTDKPLLLIGKIGRRSLEAAEALEAAGYEQLCELRPGISGLVDASGKYTENGWTQLGLPWEEQTDGGTYKELLNKANLSPAAAAAPPASKAAPASSNDPPGLKRLGAGDAYKLKAVGYVYLDVRAPEEYEKGHPVGALNIPFQTFGKGGSFRDNPDFLTVVEKLYAKGQKLLIIGKIGKRSLAAAEALVKAGYRDVCELRPGVKGLVDNTGHYSEDGWETMGLPTETSTDGGTYAELREKAGL